MIAEENSPALAPSDDETPVKKVCISGKLLSGRKKADYEAPLRSAGYSLVDDVTKDLNYLVLAEPDSTSSKAVKARELGVEVIPEERLMKMINLLKE